MQPVRASESDTTRAWIPIFTGRDGSYRADLPAGDYLFKPQIERQVTAMPIALESGATRRQDLRLSTPEGVRTTAGRGSGHWQGLSVADGLVTNTIYAIEQDRDGLLWFGGEGGASRYDGHALTTFTTADGLAHNWVSDIHRDRNGDLWFATRGGVTRYDGTVWKTFTEQDGLAGNDVLCIVEDAKGDLWFSGNYVSRGITRFDGQSMTVVTTAQGLAGDSVPFLSVDRRGRVWALSPDGVRLFDGVRFNSYSDSLSGHTVTVVLLDSRDRLWFGTTQGDILRYDGAVWEATPDGFSQGMILEIFEDRQGTIWFGKQSGVSRHDGGEAFDRFLEEDAVAELTVSEIMEDDEGGLWFGTGWYGFKADGARRFSREEIVTFGTEHGLQDADLIALAQDQVGNLWSISQAGWLSRYDGSQFVSFSSEDGVELYGSNSLVFDRKGTLWISAYPRVTTYDGDSFMRPFPGLGTSIALLDPEGDIWVPAWGGISRIRGDTFRTYPIEPIDTRNLWIRDLAQTADGTIWGAIWHYGLWRFDGSTFTAPLTAADGMDESPACLFVDAQDNLWIGTHTSGVGRFDGTNLEMFSQRDGLTSNWVDSITQDSRGHLWFGTHGGGITRYDGLVFQALQQADGLPHGDVRDLLQDSRGDIWIATAEGLTRVRPSTRKPPVKLINVIADREYGPFEQLRLPTSQNLLSFEFVGRSIRTRRGHMAYVYRLRGYDDDWQVTRDTRVRYSDLPEGEFTFEVKAVDRDLNYSDPARVRIDMFYQPLTSSVRLTEVVVQDQFVSIRNTNSDSVGFAVIINDEAETVDATVSLFIPDVMTRPWEQSLQLLPHATRSVALSAPLPASVLELDQSLQVEAEVALSVEAVGQTVALKEKRQIQVHGRGALTWDDVRHAAAIVTPADEAVATFVRPLMVTFAEQITSLGRSGINVLRALVLFEALEQHGVSYLVDANSPYSRVSAHKHAVDQVQYPAQVLLNKTGDCDDLTVLYCALLEHAGVSTALVDYPGHVFMLLDTGLAHNEAYKLPFAPDLYVVRHNGVWIPVEVTRLGDSFIEAWRSGARQLARVSPSEQRRLFVDVADAWQSFPPGAPRFAGEIEAAIDGGTRGAVMEQYSALNDVVDDWLEAEYLDSLEDRPSDRELWTRLARVYVSLTRYDDAIRSAYARLIDLRGSDAEVFNHLGIANYLKGEIEQAGYFFKQAVDSCGPGLPAQLLARHDSVGEGRRADCGAGESAGGY